MILEKNSSLSRLKYLWILQDTTKNPLSHMASRPVFSTFRRVAKTRYSLEKSFPQCSSYATRFRSIFTLCAQFPTILDTIVGGAISMVLGPYFFAKSFPHDTNINPTFFRGFQHFFGLNKPFVSKSSKKIVAINNNKFTVSLKLIGIGGFICYREIDGLLQKPLKNWPTDDTAKRPKNAKSQLYKTSSTV